MNNSINIIQIVNQIEKLDYNNKINLLSRLVDLLKKEGKVIHPTPLSSLKGLGKIVWQKIDTDLYLSEERGSWVGPEINKQYSFSRYRQSLCCTCDLKIIHKNLFI